MWRGVTVQDKGHRLERGNALESRNAVRARGYGWIVDCPRCDLFVLRRRQTEMPPSWRGPAALLAAAILLALMAEHTLPIIVLYSGTVAPLLSPADLLPGLGRRPTARAYHACRPRPIPSDSCRMSLLERRPCTQRVPPMRDITANLDALYERHIVDPSSCDLRRRSTPQEDTLVAHNYAAITGLRDLVSGRSKSGARS